MQLDPRLKPWHHPASTDSKPLLLRQALCLTRHTFWSVSRLASSSRDCSYASSIKTLSKDFAGRPEFCLSCFGSLNTNLLRGCSGWRWQYTTSHTQSSLTLWTIHIALFFGKIAAIEHLPLKGGHLGFKRTESSLGMSIKSTKGAGDGLGHKRRGPPPQYMWKQAGRP